MEKKDMPKIKSIHENQQGEVWLSDRFASLSTGGGKPGQGYPCILFQKGNVGEWHPSKRKEEFE